ncbi:MAG: hypothetical protein BMS9Abin37_0224 [Acidobacteriota bacterium]|nr:MAG: hypothetical protein BMS9Abin37_0224 [Acidobacteriota bacterium]
MRQCSKCERRFAALETVCPHDGTILSDTADTVSFEEQAVGKTLDGKYRIDGFLKRGGMGAVYRGTHVMLNKPVAIKLIKPELVSSTDVVQRFLREARAAAHLSHPNIVTVHDLGQTADGTLYIAMELVDGSSLKELIVSEGAWEPKRTVRLFKGIGSALALAHREGIVHRDLKPQNIMVSRDSEGNEIPKLLDFGIAKTFEPSSPALTSTGMVLGTPHYMSAEQAKGQPADQRSDLYALGVILYEMLVGRVPFDDTSIPQILIKHLSEPPEPPNARGASIPTELEAVVLRCLEKEPDDRYQSAEELMNALDAVPDTAAQDVAVPTIAVTPEPVAATKPVEATRETTLAGAAAAASPPLPPFPSLSVARSATATMRAHEVRTAETKAGASRFLLFGFLVVAVVALIALFLLRGRSAPPPEPTEPVVAASTAETPEKSPESIEREPEAVTEASTEASTELGPPATSVAAAQASEPESVRAPPPASTTSARPQPVQVVEPALPPPLPKVPVIGVTCEGVRDGCGALRFAIIEECKKRRIPTARPPRSDVIVHLDVEEIEARSEQQFGTTFVVRTYSIEAVGTSPHFDDELVLPPQMVTFDARLGREKLRERSRVIASELVAAVRAYWTRRRDRR